jgi:hypothetical protein
MPEIRLAVVPQPGFRTLTAAAAANRVTATRRNWVKQFKDAKERPWNVAITVSSIERVIALAGVNLCRIVGKDEGSEENALVIRLTTEPVLVGKVLWALLQPQAEAQGVSRDELLDLEGEQYAEAFNCFTAELMDFFRHSGLEEQATALEAQLKVLLAAARHAKATIEGVNIEEVTKRFCDVASKRMHQRIESTLSSFATDSQASSESTPPR